MNARPEAPSSYHHISPAELKELKFNVQIRCIRSEHEDGEGSKQELTWEISWMEHIDRHSEEETLSIFTSLNASDDAGALSMVIMARHGSSNDMVLCTIKAYEDQVVATPAFSTIEAEDYDNNNVFLSNRGAQMIALEGERLTTYTIFSSKGNQYCYSIECNIESGRGLNLDQRIHQQNDLRRESLCRQRELIRKDFENSGRLYQDCCRKWSNHTSVEIISAAGFLHPNILFSIPTQPRLMIRYRLLKKSSKGNDVVVLKGHTDRVTNTPAVRSTIEFAVSFVVTFIVIFFVSMHDLMLDVS